MRNNEVVTRKEYIEREEAIAFMNEVEPCICHDPDGAVFTATKDSNMLEFLRAIPAADVAPVVRCGECEHWWDNGTDLCSCERDALLRRRDFFCADGKRKDGDGARSNERT